MAFRPYIPPVLILLITAVAVLIFKAGIPLEDFATLAIIYGFPALFLMLGSSVLGHYTVARLWGCHVAREGAILPNKPYSDGDVLFPILLVAVLFLAVLSSLTFVGPWVLREFLESFYLWSCTGVFVLVCLAFSYRMATLANSWQMHVMPLVLMLLSVLGTLRADDFISQTYAAKTKAVAAADHRKIEGTPNEFAIQIIQEIIQKHAVKDSLPECLDPQDACVSSVIAKIEASPIAIHEGKDYRMISRLNATYFKEPLMLTQSQADYLRKVK